MEGGMSGAEDNVEELEDLVREDHKNWKICEQTMCDLLNITKCICIEGEIHSNSAENILNQP